MNKRSKSEHYLVIAPKNLFLKASQKLNVTNTPAYENAGDKRRQGSKENFSNLVSYQNIRESHFKNENLKPKDHSNYE